MKQGNGVNGERFRSWNSLVEIAKSLKQEAITETRSYVCDSRRMKCRRHNECTTFQQYPHEIYWETRPIKQIFLGWNHSLMSWYLRFVAKRLQSTIDSLKRS